MVVNALLIYLFVQEENARSKSIELSLPDECRAIQALHCMQRGILNFRPFLAVREALFPERRCCLHYAAFEAVFARFVRDVVFHR